MFIIIFKIWLWVFLIVTILFSIAALVMGDWELMVTALLNVGTALVWLLATKDINLKE